MGRPGVGGGGSSRPMSVRSSSRTTSSHRVSSSSSRSSASRPGIGRSGSSYGGSAYRSSGVRPPIYPRSSFRAPVYYGGYGGYGRSRRGGGLAGLIVFLVVVIILFSVLRSSSNNSSIPVSTRNRDKLTMTSVFEYDCIIDELGWVNNYSIAKAGMSIFYRNTGVQPFMYFVKYMPSVTTNAEREQWAQRWYDREINNEYTMAVFYFAESDPDEVGLTTIVQGKAVDSVMDSEAREIFYGNLDKFWYDSNLSMELVISSTFQKTGESIMKKSATAADVNRARFIWLAVIAGGVIVVVVMVLRRKHQKEQNEETERILNTPLDMSSPTDELADKYTK